MVINLLIYEVLQTFTIAARGWFQARGQNYTAFALLCFHGNCQWYIHIASDIPGGLWLSMTQDSWLIPKTSAFLINVSKRKTDDARGWWRACCTWMGQHELIWVTPPCSLPYRAWQEPVVSQHDWGLFFFFSFLLLCKPLSFLHRRSPWHLPISASLTSIFGFLFDTINGLCVFCHDCSYILSLSHPRQPG